VPCLQQRVGRSDHPWWWSHPGGRQDQGPWVRGWPRPGGDCQPPLSPLEIDWDQWDAGAGVGVGVLGVHYPQTTLGPCMSACVPVCLQMMPCILCLEMMGSRDDKCRL
jgi:hypothetical protein